MSITRLICLAGDARVPPEDEATDPEEDADDDLVFCFFALVTEASASDLRLRDVLDFASFAAFAFLLGPGSGPSFGSLLIKCDLPGLR